MKRGGNRPPGDNPLLFSISGTGSYICPVAQARLDIPRSLITQSRSTGGKPKCSVCVGLEPTTYRVRVEPLPTEPSCRPLSMNVCIKMCNQMGWPYSRYSLGKYYLLTCNQFKMPPRTFWRKSLCGPVWHPGIFADECSFHRASVLSGAPLQKRKQLGPIREAGTGAWQTPSSSITSGAIQISSLLQPNPSRGNLSLGLYQVMLLPVKLHITN